MAQSEQFKIAKMQMWRDIALGGMDVITRNPTIGLLTTIFLAEGGKRLGWISSEAKTSLVAGLVTGSIIGSIAGGFTQGNANTPAPLPAAIDVVTKGIAAAAKGTTKAVQGTKKAVKGIAKKIKGQKGQKALQGEIVYMLPEHIDYE